MVHVERFDPAVDTGLLRRCHEIARAGQSADDPDAAPQSLGSFAFWWTRGYNGNPRQAWVARDGDGDGEPAGCYLLTLPEPDNPTMAYWFPSVAPAARRAGIGRALLAHCAHQARLAGRSRLVSEAKEHSAGAAYAASAGARSGIGEVVRRLDVDADLMSRLGVLRADAEQHASGYRLLSWLGRTPEPLMNDRVRLDAAMADAPRDADVEPEELDAEQIRTWEHYSIEAGQRLHSVAAQHEATGRVVAVTQLKTDPGAPGWGYQQLTAVLPEHRGHRLGLLVKIAMLELVSKLEPDLRRIVTGNADSNQHMIVINERLGFEVSSVYRTWQLDLPEG